MCVWRGKVEENHFPQAKEKLKTEEWTRFEVFQKSTDEQNSIENSMGKVFSFTNIIENSI